MRIRQIVFAATELQPSAARLRALLDMDAPYRDPGVAEFGLDNAVFVFGDQFVEIVAPVRAGTTAGRLLQRRGDGGYMLILQTDDLARERNRLHQLGVREVWSAAFDDISAVHLHPKDVGGAIVSLDEPRPAATWRWGGPEWRVQPGVAGERRVRGVELRSPDPQRLAARWAEVLGRPAPGRHGEGWRVALVDGWVDVVAGVTEGLSGFTLALDDAEAVLARARAGGLSVTAGGFSMLGAQWRLQPL